MVRIQLRSPWPSLGLRAIGAIGSGTGMLTNRAFILEPMSSARPNPVRWQPSCPWQIFEIELMTTHGEPTAIPKRQSA